MPYNTISDDVTMPGSEGTLLANRYRIVRQLGQGGMGSVWLAEDTQLDDKQFAIKMLPSILVSNKRAYNQLKSEALVAMRLVHPNIVQIRAFEENNGNPFLVIDYIDGQTLDDYLAEKGALSEGDTIKLLKPIAAALDYAHGEGVVHRDVKPANVMIRKDGHPYILDFGIAREIQETMTRVTGKLSSGTLLYMSPEQLRGLPPKPAQDVYSFAAMAYECMSGHPPFYRGAIEAQIKNEQPETLGPHIIISGSVAQGLLKNPEDRPPTCEAVVEGNVSREVAGPQHDVVGASQAKAVREEKTGSHERLAVSSGRTGTVKVVFLIVILALLGVGGWLGWQKVDGIAKAQGTKIVKREQVCDEDSSQANDEKESVDIEPEDEIVRLVNEEKPDDAYTVEDGNDEAVAVVEPESDCRTKAAENQCAMGETEHKAEIPDQTNPPVRAETKVVIVPEVKTVTVEELSKIDTSLFKGGECCRVDVTSNVVFDMAWCPPHSFLMGSPVEECDRMSNETQHEVEIKHGFWIGLREVSQSLWIHVTGKNPSCNRHVGEEEDYPVDSVSRDDCLSFIAVLNEQAGTDGFRLPTEMEWEYACRAGATTAYCFGDYATSVDMQVRGSRQDRGPVKSGTYHPNAWGIFDMHGNLAEWCYDRYLEYGSLPDRRNRGYVLRGGSWHDRASSARSAARDNQKSDKRSPMYGMRLCFSVNGVEEEDRDWVKSENTLLALDAFEAGNWSLGFSLSERADVDNPDIQQWLGKCYDPFVSTPGFRIDKDSSKANEHYSRARKLSNQKKGTEEK